MPQSNALVQTLQHLYHVLQWLRRPHQEPAPTIHPARTKPLETVAVPAITDRAPRQTPQDSDAKRASAFVRFFTPALCSRRLPQHPHPERPPPHPVDVVEDDLSSNGDIAQTEHRRRNRGSIARAEINPKVGAVRAQAKARGVPSQPSNTGHQAIGRFQALPQSNDKHECRNGQRQKLHPLKRSVAVLVAVAILTAFARARRRKPRHTRLALCLLMLHERVVAADRIIQCRGFQHSFNSPRSTGTHPYSGRLGKKTWSSFLLGN